MRKLILFIFVLILISIVYAGTITHSNFVINGDANNNSATNYTMIMTQSDDHSDTIYNSSFWQDVEHNKSILLAYDFNVLPSNRNITDLNGYYNATQMQSLGVMYGAGYDGSGAWNDTATNSRTCLSTYTGNELSEEWGGNWSGCLSFKFNGASVATNNYWLLGKWATSGGNGNRSWAVWISDASSRGYALVFRTTANGVNNQLNQANITGNITEGRWYRTCWVYDPTYNWIYLNGTAYDRKDRNTDGIYNSNRPIAIGQSITTDTTYNNGFNGTIDDIIIYKYALTPEQIQEDSDAWFEKRSTKLIANNYLATGQNWTASFWSGNNISYTNISKTFNIQNVCQYSGSGNWVLDAANNCRISTATRLYGNLSCRGTGSLTFLQSVSFAQKPYSFVKEKGCKFVMERSWRLV